MGPEESIGFRPTSNTLTGGEMSFSNEYRSQENDSDPAHPPLHQDIAGSSVDEMTNERAGSDDASLVEQILEFLDRYPVCFARRATITGYTQSC